MRRFHIAWILSFLWVAAKAQTLFTADCSARTVCLAPGSCTKGFLIASASPNPQSGCQNLTPNLGWQLDLNNDGGINQIGGTSEYRDSLPIGSHRLIWRAVDICGKVDTCSVIVTVRDCQPPNMTAINSFSVPLDAGDSCRLTIRASQFIINLSDNCTPRSQIRLGLRRAGVGTGFPADSTVTFGRCDLGTQILELWARDAGGLANLTNVFVIVQNGQSVCSCNPTPPPPPPPPAPTRFNCVMWPDSSPFQVTPVYFHFPTVGVSGTSFRSDSSCSNLIPAPSIPISVGKTDSVLYEVNLLDVLKIQRHILGLTPLTNPFAQVAADVNNSKTITASDMVEMRKVILGAEQTFSQLPSFRFVSAYHYGAFGKFVDLDTLRSDPSLPPSDFFAIKIGNVDTRYVKSLIDASDRSQVELGYEIVQKDGQTVLILRTRQALRDLAGFQLAFAHLPAIHDAPTHEAFQDIHGNVRILKVLDTPQSFSPGDVLYELMLSEPTGRAIQFVNDFPQLLAVQASDGNAQPIPLRLTLLRTVVQDRISPNPVIAGTELTLQAYDARTWALRDLSGRLISQGAMNESVRITAPGQAGVYLLSVDTRMYKVVVIH